jgi:hypothetical protein
MPLAVIAAEDQNFEEHLDLTWMRLRKRRNIMTGIKVSE